MSTSQDDDVNTQSMVKVRVYDKGDYYGNGIDFLEDQSDNVFTVADHRLHKNLSSGWNLFGPALEQYDNHISVGLDGGSDGNNDDSWWSDLGNSLGDWGSNWVAYTSNGTYDNIFSYQGIGYYLALASDETMVVTGTAYSVDPDASGTSGQARSADYDIGPNANGDQPQVNEWNLSKGWNLVSNPLVVMVSKYRFEVYDGDIGPKSFDEAVNSGWIAPSIYGLFENSYESYNRLTTFGGYWVNTSRELRVEIHPYYLDSDGNTEYTMVLNNLETVNGNSVFFAGAYAWDFVVSNDIDTTPPEISSIIPINESSANARNSIVQINFSEAINPNTAAGIQDANNNIKPDEIKEYHSYLTEKMENEKDNTNLLKI